MTCDLCLTDHRWLWMFPARGFTIIAPGGTCDLPAQEWAVCDDCKPFIDTPDYHGLAERVIATNPRGDMQGIRDLTRLLMQNIDGPLIHVESDAIDLKMNTEVRVRRLGGTDEWVTGRVLLISPNRESVALEIDGAVRAQGGFVFRILPLSIDYEKCVITGLTGDKYEIDVRVDQIKESETAR